MIPKVIHYCWFGNNKLSKEETKCINSWKNFFPDYKIIEWNESNFDINCCRYVKEADEAKKWAFVTDYARYKILYENGGIYFDTDVEVIKNFDNILKNGPFMGCENKPFVFINNTKTYNKCKVASGLGCAADPHMDIYKELLDDYEKDAFINDDGSYNLLTVVDRTTNILREHGLNDNDYVQNICGINIYPSEYFCPMDMNTGKIDITDNTYSIHKYRSSWVDKNSIIRGKIYKTLNRVIGPKYTNIIRKYFGRNKEV